MRISHSTCVHYVRKDQLPTWNSTSTVRGCVLQCSIATHGTLVSHQQTSHWSSIMMWNSTCETSYFHAWLHCSSLTPFYMYVSVPWFHEVETELHIPWNVLHFYIYIIMERPRWNDYWDTAWDIFERCMHEYFFVNTMNKVTIQYYPLKFDNINNSF